VVIVTVVDITDPTTAGETIEVPVYATRGADASRDATVTVTATSENSPSATATVTCSIDAPGKAK